MRQQEAPGFERRGRRGDGVIEPTVIDERVGRNDDVERQRMRGHVGGEVGLDELVVKCALGCFFQHPGREVHAH
jgi:hypothetical protein